MTLDEKGLNQSLNGQDLSFLSKYNNAYTNFAVSPVFYVWNFFFDPEDISTFLPFRLLTGTAIKTQGQSKVKSLVVAFGIDRHLR